MGGCLSVSLCNNNDNNNNNNIIIPFPSEEEEAMTHHHHHHQKKKKKKKKKKIRPPTAKVISFSGALHEFPLPASVSHVLLSLHPSSSDDHHPHPPPPQFFLCDSDLLSYDDFIPQLKSDAHLLLHHLYFLLPSSKLRTRVSASDMAALAVKASLALQSSSSSDTTNKKKKDGHYRSRKARISPVLLLNNNPSSVDTQHSYTIINNNLVSSKTPAPPSPLEHNNPYDNNIIISNRLGDHDGLPTSGSVHRSQKYASRRAKLAVRSFRLRLATIYEGTALLS